METMRFILFLSISSAFTFGAKSQDVGVDNENLISDKNLSRISYIALDPDIEKSKKEQDKLKLDINGQPVFDLNMLHGNRSLEVANFDSISEALPGLYNVDLIFNGESITTVNVEFKKVENKVIPCFTKNLLSALNVDFELLSEDNLKLINNLSNGVCTPIEKLIDGATADFEIGSLSLVVFIPQAFLKKVPRGYVNPEFWEKGINAASMSYRLGHYRTNSGQFDSHSSYASLQGGINFNGWNVRHFGYFSSQSNVGSPSIATYDSINTYAEKAIPKINAKIIFGDSFTDGAVSESLGIRGFQIKSSDLMLPASMRGYAPVVRGVALTNAKVEVFQNGNLIYETTVAPGPFVINDLYPSINNSNLDVVVTESDGSKSNFIVPNSSMPQLVREGQFRYSAAFGKFRNSGSTTKADLSKVTVQYGISNYLTAYSGITISNNYQAGLIGSVYENDYGAFSGDIEFSSANFNNLFISEKYTGNRVRVGYAQLFDSTKSNIDISAYSYNNNYWGVESKVNYDESTAFIDPDKYNRDRRKIQLTFSQPLDRFGSVYLMLSKNKYWNNENSLLTLQAGYARNFTINNYNFGLNFNYLRNKMNGFGNVDNDRFALTLTFPLGSNYTNNLTTTFAHDRERGNSEQVRLNGSIDQLNKTNYGLYVDSMQNQGTISGGNIQHRTSAAIFDASASTGSRSTQMSASISGGFVLHEGGLTFANQLGDTLGIVYAPNAKGAIVQNSQGIEVDSNGYAIVPYLSAYQRNNVLLNTQNVPSDVTFESTTEQTIPYENAIVLLKFETTIGKAALFDITRSDGTPPPFGSVVILPDGKEVGIVGQGGNTFVYGLQDQGNFDVKWGEASDQKCVVKFDLKLSKSINDAYAQEDVACLPIEGT